MPTPLTLLDQTFASQKAANEFFYAMRDRYLASKTDIADSRDFDLLHALMSQYCDTPEWEMPSAPVSFYVRNIARGVGAKGGTTQGFVVRFAEHPEREFSVRDAVSYVANRQKKS